MTDVKRFTTTEGGTALCIDTTFDVGDFYLTTTTFKEIPLLMNKDQGIPTFIGPSMIHYSKDTNTYAHLLFELRKMIRVDEDILFIGSDDDKALSAAISLCFEGTRHLLCARHVQENIERYLQNKGHPMNFRTAIINDIFHEKKGFTYADDSVTRLLQLYYCILSEIQMKRN